MDVSKTIQRQWWAQGLRNTKRDLKSIRWKRIGHVTGIFIWFSGIIACLILVDLTIIRSLSYSIYDDCRPYGSFNPWAPSGFLDINVRFGSLTFAAAKAIDIAWDIIFGRGGQLILAFISCQTFKRYAMASMSIIPLTCKTFWLIFTQNEPGSMTVIDLCREFTSRRGLKSKGAMVYILVSSIYVIIFPTFAGAMTGYTAVGQVFFKEGGNLLRFDNFQYAAFIIHDGDRIGLGKDHVVGYGSEDLRQFGANGANNITSVWEHLLLPAPTLNISDYYSSWIPMYKSSQSNKLYDASAMELNRICKPAEWGFSFLQLNLMFISLIIWSAGTYIIWLKAHPTRIEREEIPEYLKCALHLSSAIQHELRDSCSDPEELTNQELKTLLQNEAKGGHMRLSELNSPDMYSFKQGLQKCIKKNKWVLISTPVMLLVLLAPYINALSHFQDYYYHRPVPPPAIMAFSGLAGILILTFTPVIGRSDWSKTFLMTCVVLVASFITGVWAIHNHFVQYRGEQSY